MHNKPILRLGKRQEFVSAYLSDKMSYCRAMCKFELRKHNLEAVSFSKFGYRVFTMCVLSYIYLYSPWERRHLAVFQSYIFNILVQPANCKDTHAFCYYSLNALIFDFIPLHYPDGSRENSKRSDLCADLWLQLLTSRGFASRTTAAILSKANASISVRFASIQCLMAARR